MPYPYDYVTIVTLIAALCLLAYRNSGKMIPKSIEWAPMEHNVWYGRTPLDLKAPSYTIRCLALHPRPRYSASFNGWSYPSYKEAVEACEEHFRTRVNNHLYHTH